MRYHPQVTSFTVSRLKKKSLKFSLCWAAALRHPSCISGSASVAPQFASHSQAPIFAIDLRQALFFGFFFCFGMCRVGSVAENTLAEMESVKKIPSEKQDSTRVVFVLAFIMGSSCFFLVGSSSSAGRGSHRLTHIPSIMASRVGILERRKQKDGNRRLTRKEGRG